jgi:hypothetical protein
MIELIGGKKEVIVRQWFNDAKGGLVPTKCKVLDIYAEFELDNQEIDISYGLFNAVMKKIQAEGHVGEAQITTRLKEVYSVVPIEPVVMRVDEMDFPQFGLFKTGKPIDLLFSDHEEGGGIYGGTVNIVIGESGVGKSTVLLDMLSSIKETQPEAKILYISSEMTRNDILFYYKKTPAIGKVPTLLLMDYVKSGQLSQVLEKAFNDHYDIILLDSYQDVLVKLVEVQQWKSKFAEGWLTGMMIDAAERNGTGVLAIQHMTKGGQYVGGTYLKHATQGMVEIKFDQGGQRYVEFSKNRRGGSMTGKKLYYSLDSEGAVVYDIARFNEDAEVDKFKGQETARFAELTQKFENIFLSTHNHDEVEDEDKY